MPSRIVRGEAAIVLDPATSDLRVEVDLTEAEIEALPEEIFHKRRGRVLLKSRPRNVETLARRIARSRGQAPQHRAARPRAIRRVR